jgi:PTS system mannose-specific IIB component
VKIDKLNVGGMRMQEGRKSLSRAVAVTPEEEQAFKSIIARNIPVEIQMVPKDPVVDLQTLISTPARMTTFKTGKHHVN